MRKTTLALFAAALAFAAMPTAASAEAPAPTTFVVTLNAADEVPLCAQATSASRGVAIFRVRGTGTVEWTLVANNLPGTTITGAHIHLAPEGESGSIVQGLSPLSSTTDNGVIGMGSFSNTALLAAIRANPQNYYVNVHSNVCPRGVIRGQFGDTGP
jgi:hypothetical protein